MRITIVSYHFTPSTMVAAMRARGLAKQLGRMGHDVTVVTAEPAPETSGEWRVITVPGVTFAKRVRRAIGVSDHHTVVDALAGGRRGSLDSILRFARRTLQEFVFWPDEAAGWARAVRKRLAPDLAGGAIDVIITTSPPVSTSIVPLRTPMGVTWIADFRDLWTLAHHYPFSTLRRRLDQRLEARVVARCDAVTVATRGFEALMRSAYPGAHITTVYNGYDPEMFDTGPLRTPNERFTLVHAGNLYGGRVDPSIFFEAIAALLHSGRIPRDRIRVEFFSASEAWLLRAVQSHGLADVVHVRGIRPRQEVLWACSQADVLVLLQWNDPGESAVLPAKTLEYLGSRRFILSVGSPPDGEVTELLEATGAGRSVNTAGATADVLEQLYDEFEEQGFVGDRADQRERERWTQEAMAEAMHQVILEARKRARAAG